jgi:4'-phosphopantetheinyl transferase
MMIRPWNESRVGPILPAGDVQLWLAWLDKEAPGSFGKFLCEDEYQRVGRLRSPRSAERFTIARGILRILLGHTLGTRPEQLVFAYGAHGKPELAGGMQKELAFNVSHCGGLAIFAIANGLVVGVDIEEIRPVSNIEASASIFLSPDELVEFEALPDGGKLERFFTLWTCKEAILKAIGSGFSSPVKDILATFCQPALKGDGKHMTFQKKGLTLFDPAEGFTGALACL